MFLEISIFSQTYQQAPGTFSIILEHHRGSYIFLKLEGASWSLLKIPKYS